MADGDFSLCSICYETYCSSRVPKVLICGHTFCAVCLRQLRTCPRCAMPFHLSAVPTNFDMLNLLEMMRKRDKSVRDMSMTVIGALNELNLSRATDELNKLVEESAAEEEPPENESDLISFANEHAPVHDRRQQELAPRSPSPIPVSPSARLHHSFHAYGSTPRIHHNVPSPMRNSQFRTNAINFDPNYRESRQNEWPTVPSPTRANGGLVFMTPVRWRPIHRQSNNNMLPPLNQNPFVYPSTFYNPIYGSYGRRFGH